VPGLTGPARSLDAASHEETVKIGFVSLLGHTVFCTQLYSM
jgi:hypothetical protein